MEFILLFSEKKIMRMQVWARMYLELRISKETAPPIEKKH